MCRDTGCVAEARQAINSSDIIIAGEAQEFSDTLCCAVHPSTIASLPPNSVAESLDFTCRNMPQQSTNPLSPYVNRYGACFYTDENASPSCSVSGTSQMSVCCCSTSGNATEDCPTFNGGLFGGIYPDSDEYTLVAAGDVPGNDNPARLQDAYLPINDTYLPIETVAECADLCDAQTNCTSFVVFDDEVFPGTTLGSLACSLLDTQDFSLKSPTGTVGISFVKTALYDLFLSTALLTPGVLGGPERL